MSEKNGNGSNASDGGGLWARPRPGWRESGAPGEAEEVPVTESIREQIF